MRAFEKAFEMPVKGRSAKPRKVGYTMVIDKGLGLSATKDLMTMAAAYIDALKQTFGTSAFVEEQTLRKKIKLVKDAGVEIYPGGTFLEVAVAQGSYATYLQETKKLGFTTVEVSDGTVEMSPAVREEVIKRAVDAGFKVITEVGKKDPKVKVGHESMGETVHRDLALGAFKVIVEARESGKGVGIYDASGGVDETELNAIAALVSDPSVLIWEAPLKNQQAHLIKKFGVNVNLGNVPPEDILALEALRCGLRADTLKPALGDKVKVTKFLG